MPELAVQSMSLEGLSPVYSPASEGGDYYEYVENAFLHVKNGGAAPITVTVQCPPQCNYGFTHDAEVVVAASEEAMIGRLGLRFKDTNNQVQIGYSDVTNVTVAAIAM